MNKTGTKNIASKNKALKNIESLVSVYKKRRMSDEQFIKLINQNLASISKQRDYIEYLQNIGQY
jgi:hypothetical protein